MKRLFTPCELACPWTWAGAYTSAHHSQDMGMLDTTPARDAKRALTAVVCF